MFLKGRKVIVGYSDENSYRQNNYYSNSVTTVSFVGENLLIESDDSGLSILFKKYNSLSDTQDK